MDAIRTLEKGRVIRRKYESRGCTNRSLTTTDASCNWGDGHLGVYDVMAFLNPGGASPRAFNRPPQDDRVSDQNSPITSPPARVIKQASTTSLMLSLIERTVPSPIAT